MIFLSCLENARVYDAKSGHGPHSPPPPGAAASPKRLEESRISPVCDYPVWAQNPDSYPAMFIPPIISPGPPRRYSVVSPVKDFSLT